MRHSLPQLGAKKEGLGRPTIMDRTMAQRYGVPYVHLAAFAIDVDRAREALDEDESNELPMGWEVFLTARYLEANVDAKDETARSMLEDLVLAIFDLPPSEDAVFGSQLPFAVWYCVERGIYPTELSTIFKAWKAKPKELAKDLDRLAAEAESTQRLAKACVDAPLDPPMAPPTSEALAKLVG